MLRKRDAPLHLFTYLLYRSAENQSTPKRRVFVLIFEGMLGHLVLRVASKISLEFLKKFKVPLDLRTMHLQHCTQYSMVEPPNGRNQPRVLQSFVPVHQLSSRPSLVYPLLSRRCERLLYQSLLFIVHRKKGTICFVAGFLAATIFNCIYEDGTVMGINVPPPLSSSSSTSSAKRTDHNINDPIIVAARTNIRILQE